jgi:hypothetical protein
MRLPWAWIILKMLPESMPIVGFHSTKILLSALLRGSFQAYQTTCEEKPLSL